jgi:hypothetical protein
MTAIKSLCVYVHEELVDFHWFSGYFEISCTLPTKKVPHGNLDCQVFFDMSVSIPFGEETRRER